MTAIIPVYLFFVGMNLRGLANEPNWQVRYILLVFIVPAAIGLIVEGAAHQWSRRMGYRAAFMCVMRNFAGGLVGLGIAWVALLAAPWFDSWPAPSVNILIVSLVTLGVFGAGGYLNARVRGRTRNARTSYLSNATAVLMGGGIGVVLGLGAKGWWW